MTNSIIAEMKLQEARQLQGTDRQPGYDYAQQQALDQLAYGHLTHRQVAGMVRMLMRTDWNHEAVVCAARDRIAWLAKRVEDLEAQLKGDA